MFMVKEKLFALARELIAELKDRDSLIVERNNQYYCDIYITKSNHVGPTHRILTEEEILNNTEALRKLFAWAFEEFPPPCEEDYTQGPRDGVNTITITNGVGHLSFGPIMYNSDGTFTVISLTGIPNLNK